MCGRLTLARSDEILAARFGATIPPIAPRYNIAPMQPLLLIRRGIEGREATFARWGLIPSWAKDPKIAASCFNARSEGVAEKPAFRGAFRRKRCLIPADGFYEWTGPSKDRRPVRFHLRDGGPFAIAGLWDRWVDSDGGAIETATLITCAPNELVAGVHDRMPAILKPEDYDEWLNSAADPRGLLELLRPHDAGDMAATLASKLVNSVKNEGAELLAGAA